MAPVSNPRKKSIRHRWAKVLWIIWLLFAEGGLPEELTWETMVLLTKGEREYQDIGMMEVA